LDLVPAVKSPTAATQEWLNAVASKAGFARLDLEAFPDFSPGTVWLVGAGPGAPGLLSLLAYHALQHCDVVVYDALVNADILRWTRPGAEVEYAGKRGGKPSPSQRDISFRLIELARQGKRVLRLKGGDPFIFGRGGEEAGHIARAGVPFRIVPGITAGIGGLAYAGIPATHRDVNHSILFLTGHDASGAMPSNVNWKAVAGASPVIVMYMAVKHLVQIAMALLEGGRDRDDTVMILSRATLPQQEVYETTLAGVKECLDRHAPPTPAIVVIGRLSGWRKTLDWYQSALRENRIG
jgi:uroporphyrin-III C-methyltransferase